MQSVVSILLLFILLNTLLKLSFWRGWQAVIWTAGVAVFILLAAPFASEQSKTLLEAWIRSPEIMQNVAVLVTAESVIFFAFTFMKLREATAGRRMKAWLGIPLKCYPGLLLFPALFYLLCQLYFALPGVSFRLVAWVMAGATLLLLPLLSRLARRLLQDEAYRLEMQFVASLFVCVIGLITTVNADTAYSAVEQEFSWGALLCALGLFLLFAAVGYLLRKFKKYKH